MNWYVGIPNLLRSVRGQFLCVCESVRTVTVLFTFVLFFAMR